jgi:hypothetical protein
MTRASLAIERLQLGATYRYTIGRYIWQMALDNMDWAMRSEASNRISGIARLFGPIWVLHLLEKDRSSNQLIGVAGRSFGDRQDNVQDLSKRTTTLVAKKKFL